MSWSFIRREWGAVTFIVTVIIGMIVVPLALYFANATPKALALPNNPVTPSPIACPSPTPSPSPTSSPTPSPAKSPTPSPKKTPTPSAATSPTPTPTLTPTPCP